jgi:glycosyltransferase involved in cell wall biosynthesis
VHRLRARTAGLRNVVFPGFVEGAELRTWYSVADAFVFPTLGDAYGHVVQEAMACGLPVVSTTAAGDITDRVIDGRTGFLVPPKDAAAFADTMGRLARDPTLRVELGAAGRQRIQAWSTESWAEGFEAMALELVERRRRR